MCDQAAAKYFMNTQTAKPEKCPKGARCDEPGTTTETMELADGFYKFRTKSAEVYACPHTKNCKTAKTSGTDCRAMKMRMEIRRQSMMTPFWQPCLRSYRSRWKSM